MRTAHWNRAARRKYRTRALLSIFPGFVLDSTRRASCCRTGPRENTKGSDETVFAPHQTQHGCKKGQCQRSHAELGARTCFQLATWRSRTMVEGDSSSRSVVDAEVRARVAPVSLPKAELILQPARATSTTTSKSKRRHVEYIIVYYSLLGLYWVMYYSRL